VRAYRAWLHVASAAQAPSPGGSCEPESFIAQNPVAQKARHDGASFQCEARIDVALGTTNHRRNRGQRPHERSARAHRYFQAPFEGIDAMSATTLRAYPRHTHDQYGIGVIDSGGHASLSGRGQVEAGTGNLIFVNPGEVHDGRALGGRPRSWRMLYFDPAAMAAARNDVLEGATEAPYFAAPVLSDEPLRRAFDTAFAAAMRHDQSCQEMLAETAVLRLVAQLAVNLSSRSRKSSHSTVSIRKSRDRIDADPAAPMTLTSLAAEAGASRYQLLRAFARELGLTPHAYIVQQRLALARRLIRAGTALAEAASQAGFSDQSHLTRMFARQFGVTPARYRLRQA
jgi:AraC-like DNA-binding protein